MPSVTQTASGGDKPLNPGLPETRAHLLCSLLFPNAKAMCGAPTTGPMLTEPFEGGATVTRDLSGDNSGTPVCLSMELWSSSQGCDSTGSRPISASPTSGCQGPRKALPTPGQGRQSVASLLQSPADSGPARGRQPWTGLGADPGLWGTGGEGKQTHPPSPRGAGC